jgi:ZIP family zinc transporter
MVDTVRFGLTDSRGGLLVAGAATLGLVALTVAAVSTGDPPWKLVGISWVAFAAMAGAVPFGRRAATNSRGRPLVWGYGLASGAMITSAAAFLVPGAIGHHAEFGGFGIAAGVLVGYATHTAGHRLTHAGPFDHTAVELAAHALAAGAVIGVVYGNMPELGLLLGLSIVSHKGPAGYAAARRLASRGGSTAVLLVPASGVGLTGLTASMVQLPADPVLNALVFGFAAGVFLHVGTDYLPECEVGGEIHAAADLGEEAHHRLDRLRTHAVFATLVGGLVVFLAWLGVSGTPV